MSMNQHLAEMFGTDKIASEQAQLQDNFFKIAAALQIDLEKTASDDANGLFQAWALYEKTAANNGIDLSQYSLDSVAAEFSKWASENVFGNQGPESDPVVAQATEFLSKIASETQSYEEIIKIGTEIGQVAAHAYLAELNSKLADETSTSFRLPGVGQVTVKGKEPDDTSTGGWGGNQGKPKDDRKWAGPRSAGDTSPEEMAQLIAAKKDADSKKSFTEKMKDRYHENKLKRNAEGGTGKYLANRAREAWGHKHRNKALGIAGAATAIGGGALAYKKYKDSKEASSEKQAFDVLAARVALNELVGDGFDAKEASERLTWALEQERFEDVSDDVKVASAQDPEQGILVRAYELMARAGYEAALGNGDGGHQPFPDGVGSTLHRRSCAHESPEAVSAGEQGNRWRGRPRRLPRQRNLPLPRHLALPRSGGRLPTGSLWQHHEQTG